MPRTARTYTVAGHTGTVKELYNRITTGIQNPPSLIAFNTRLKRGERNPAELCRPPGQFSSASTQARANGLRAYHARRRSLNKPKGDSTPQPVVNLPQNEQREYTPPRHRFYREE